MFLTLLKLVGKASGFFAPFKMYLIGGALLSAAITVFVHFNNDGNRKAELAAALASLETLEEDALFAKEENDNLTERLKDQREEKLREVAAANEQTRIAKETAASVKDEKDKITEELAVANFTILEAIRDDEDYADWAYYPAHITVWSQLYNADQGETPTAVSTE